MIWLLFLLCLFILALIKCDEVRLWLLDSPSQIHNWFKALPSRIQGWSSERPEDVFTAVFTIALITLGAVATAMIIN